MVDFDCADNGMMLADENDGYAENWGPCTSCKTSNDYYSRKTVKRTFKASFLLGTFICLNYVSFVLFSQAAADKISLQHMTPLTWRLN